MSMDTESARENIMANFEDFEIGNIEPHGEGFDSRVFLVNCIYIFRFPKHSKSAQQLEVEIALLPELQRHLDLSIPSFEYVGRQQRNDFSFVGYRKIVGDALEKDYLYELDESLRDRLIRDVATFIEQLHSFPIELATECGVKITSFEESYTDDLERTRKVIYPMVDRKVQQYCETLFAGYLSRKENFDYKPTLLHADISPEHIIYDEGKREITGIIDFGDIGIGDPVYDLMYLYEDYGKGFIDTLLTYYPVDNYDRLPDKLQFFYECNTIQDVLIGLSLGDDDILRNSLKTLHQQAEKAG